MDASYTIHPHYQQIKDGKFILLNVNLNSHQHYRQIKDGKENIKIKINIKATISLNISNITEHITVEIVK